jgi:hypothetical protein
MNKGNSLESGMPGKTDPLSAVDPPAWLPMLALDLYDMTPPVF